MSTPAWIRIENAAFAATLLVLSVLLPFVATLYPQAEALADPLLRALLAVCVGLATLLLRLKVLPLRNDPLLRFLASISAFGILWLIPLLAAKIIDAQETYGKDAAIKSLRTDLRIALARQQQQALAELRAQMDAQPVDRFSRYHGQIPFADLARIRALEGDLLQQLSDRADSYRAALEQNPTRGPGDWFVARTVEDLQQQLQAHLNVYAPSRELRDFVDGMESRYREGIDALQLDEPARRVAVAELQRLLLVWEAGQIPLMRILDTEALDASITALQWLIRHWGAWRFSPRDGGLLFDDEALEYSLFEILDTLQAIEDEAAKLRTNPE